MEINPDLIYYYKYFVRDVCSVAKLSLRVFQISSDDSIDAELGQLLHVSAVLDHRLPYIHTMET